MDETKNHGDKKPKTRDFEDGTLSLRSEASSFEHVDDDDGDGDGEDPLVVFGSEIVMMILSKLDARSVALCRLVSRGWHALASTDTIWAPKDLFILQRLAS